MAVRQRKPGKEAAASSPRGAEEETAEEECSSSAPARGPGGMVWFLLVLLAAGLGAQGWLLFRQGETMRELGETVQQLRSRLQGLEGLKEKVVSAVELGRRIADLEAAHGMYEEKLEQATKVTKQILSSDPIAKISSLQAEVQRSLADIRKEFPSRMDFDWLERKIELLDSIHLEKMVQNLDDMQQTSFMLKENVTSITVSLTKAFSKVEQTGHLVQIVQEKLEALNIEVTEGMNTVLSKMLALDGGVNETQRWFEAVQSQLKLLHDLKETDSWRESAQQLEGLRELIQQLQLEKSSIAQEVNSVWRQVEDQRRELEGKAANLESALGILQTRLAQVETGSVNQNVQLSGAVEQELQRLKQGLDEMGSHIQKCFSGEVETYCETAADCSWPHIREVGFPHRLLKEPIITLGVSGLSTEGSVGVSVKAVDVTDSGFKVQIGNLGGHHLTSVKVTWMVCA
ncbi:uncharacterized protein LOC115481779 [Microcaecilia unicolor]|uniref:Uncharacterized protein LOC115481779 n=1 Tax=Microcaecilia unicolor TaxID=1415580 RepID=A0A6P7ZU82_9AMPH|nr:uncharacterized protein LOC115481779 [Microcaecilia unicolor]